MNRLMWLLREGWDGVLTYGNGPQMGNILGDDSASETRPRCAA